VYRESAFIAGGVALTVGAGGRAFANLGNSDKVRVQLTAGQHEIYVQARSAESTKILVNIKRGETICLVTSVSSNTYARIIVPNSLTATGYQFSLHRAPCPGKEELAKYKDTPVTYE
jgi:hypothetical protein